MIFRRLIAGLSQKFPPKYIADRLLPWATVVMAMFGFFWAIAEYRNDIAIKRVNTTLSLHKTFIKDLSNLETIKNKERSSVDLSDLIIKRRCVFIKKRVFSKNESKEKRDSFDCNNLTGVQVNALNAVDLNSEHRAELRKMLNVARIETFELDDGNVNQYLLFFQSVEACVRAANCDAATSIALFAKPITAFLNDICIFIEAGQNIGSEETARLGQFLIENDVHKNIFWSSDRGQENLFACDYLRKLQT